MTRSGYPKAFEQFCKAQGFGITSYDAYQRAKIEGAWAAWQYRSAAATPGADARPANILGPDEDGLPIARYSYQTGIGMVEHHNGTYVRYGEVERRVVNASPVASVLTDEQIETAATHIWDHFGPDQEMAWNEASNKDTYRSAARAALLAASIGGTDAPTDPIRALIAAHAEQLDQNDYAYFELAYTRHTAWMAWLCSNSRDDDPNRKVIAKGQGDTPEEACAAAIESQRSGDGS